MRSVVLVVAVLMGCRDPYHCASDAEKFHPEVELVDTFTAENEPPGSEYEELVCAGGLTFGEWAEIAETSPGYDPVVTLCGFWCVDEFVGRFGCVLEGTLKEWADLNCPGCKLSYGSEARYPFVSVECT